MTDVLMPEINGLLLHGAVLVLTLGVAAVLVFLIPAYRKSEFAQRYGKMTEMFIEAVTSAIMRVQFSGEDWSQFEEEAATMGRDVRLVAAMYLVDRWTDQMGYEVDEEYVVSTIERRLEELKQNGIIPRSDETQRRDNEIAELRQKAKQFNRIAGTEAYQQAVRELRSQANSDAASDLD